MKCGDPGAHVRQVRIGQQGEILIQPSCVGVVEIMNMIGVRGQRD
jgi:hypothetical protein